MEPSLSRNDSFRQVGRRMELDYYALLSRYLGRRVVLSTYSYLRIWGEVASVHQNSIRLIYTYTTEHDDGGWFQSMQSDSDDEENQIGARCPETVVQFHQIISVTCMDDDILDTPMPEKQYSLSEADEIDGPAFADNRIDDLLTVDRIEIRLGVGLIVLADSKRDGDLLNRIGGLREQLAGQLGVVMPKVRVRDDMRLDELEYRLLLDGCEVAGGEARPGKLLAIGPDDAASVPGLSTIEPAFGTAATWIEPATREKAEFHGYTLVTPSAMLVTHLKETVIRHADELLGYQAVRDMLDRVSSTDPLLVAQVAPDKASISWLHHVLRRLLEERVPVKNLVRIIESLAQFVPIENDPVSREMLVAVARIGLGREVCQPLRDRRHRIHVVSLDPPLESRLRQMTAEDQPFPDPWIAKLADRLSDRWELSESSDVPFGLLVPGEIRAPLRRSLAVRLPTLQVISYAEIPREASVELITVFKLADVAPADVVPCEAAREHSVKSIGWPPVSKLAMADPSPSEPPRENRPRQPK